PPHTHIYPLSLHDALPIASMNGSISTGPNEQFSPTTSGCACAIDMSNASTVCPLRLRPDLSITVPEIINGTLRPVFSNASGIAKDRKSTRLNSSHEWISYA